MFRSLSISSNTAVPHLFGSKLATLHNNFVAFDTDKPNVIIGPNGSGKSALMRALGYRSCSLLSGTSWVEAGMSGRLRHEGLWSGSSYRGFEFMKGLDFDCDNGPALYYAPGAIPGEYDSGVRAIMEGYSEAGHKYLDAVESKSSGEGCNARLAHLFKALKGEVPVQWLKPVEDRIFKTEPTYVWEAAPSILKKLMNKKGKPVILMDEPEQSLDARSQLQLWQAIEDGAKDFQIIIATHSLIPVHRSSRFNIIETESEYLQTLKKLSL